MRRFPVHFDPPMSLTGKLHIGVGNIIRKRILGLDELHHIGCIGRHLLVDHIVIHFVKDIIHDVHRVRIGAFKAT